MRFLIGETAVALNHGMFDTRVLHFTFFVHIENNGECQFLFVGTERADKVTQTFGQHRNGAVYQVNGRGTFFGFFIYGTSFFYIMCNVGNMYSDLPQSRFDKSDGKSIVKVFCILGVDGEGSYGPEILPFGIVGLCYLSRNLFGGGFHILGIYIRQSVFR